MKYESKLSALRHLALKLQGLDLKSVLLRAAADKAEFIAREIHTAEEIFHELKAGIYKYANELPMDECYNLVSDATSLEKLKKELIDNPSRPFQWDETLHALLEGTDGNERKLLETVLTNQYNYIKESEGFSSNDSSMHSFNKILVPIVRRIFTNFEATKLVGVQPMTGPVGLAFVLRYKHADPAKVDVNGDWAKALKEDKKEDDVGDKSPEEGDFGGTAGRRMIMEIVTQAVEARSNRLSAGWTIEAMQDLGTMNCLDIEAEMIQALAAEIQIEISAGIVWDLRNLAGKAEEIEINTSDDTAAVKLACQINLACNDIAVKTRRGAGNWMVVAPTALSIFEDLPNYSENDTKANQPDALREVGTLNGTIKVFTAGHMLHDEILVGYKGSGDTDTGYVYCPYIPAMSSGIGCHPETFQPLVSLMTRYGVSLNGVRKYDEEGNEIGEELLADAEDYYNLIKVKGDLFAKKETTDEE